MDKLTHYRNCIQTLLSRYASEDILEEDVEILLSFDTERDHYQWMNVGWHQFNRVYRCIIHIDIKDGKVWLQQNLTDQDPAEELVKMGVEKKDIVLGLHPPYKRPYTEYGVA